MGGALTPDAWLPAPLAAALAPAGWLYGLAARARVALWRRGWRRRLHPPGPTLSIGNLAVGGTGKTPFLLHVLGELRAAGVRAAVLSRGHGGDEGRLLEAAFPEVLLAEDPDRRRGLARLLARGGESPNVFLLDDGFQHLHLERDLDVVLLDARRPLGPCLPAGPFREPPAALARADLVILTRVDGVPDDQRQAVWARIAAARGAAPPLPRVEAELAAGELRRLDGAATAALAELAGQRVFLAAGIGRPSSFLRLCTAAGLEVSGVDFRRDHHPWRPGDARSWPAGLPVLVTGKDAVKLRAALPPEQAARTWELGLRWCFRRGEEHWRQALESLLLPVRAARIEPLWAAHDPDGRAVPRGGGEE